MTYERTSQASISINCLTELSKTVFPVFFDMDKKKPRQKLKYLENEKSF